MRKPSQQRAREKCLYAHLRTCTQSMQLFAAGAQLAAHSQPALPVNCFQQPTNTGVTWCLAQPLWGSTTTKKASLTPQHALIGFTPTPTHPSAFHTRARPCLLSRHRLHAQRTRNARATHALPLHPAALASVPYVKARRDSPRAWAGRTARRGAGHAGIRPSGVHGNNFYRYSFLAPLTLSSFLAPLTLSSFLLRIFQTYALKCIGVAVLHPGTLVPRQLAQAGGAGLLPPDTAVRQHPRTLARGRILHCDQ